MLKRSKTQDKRFSLIFDKIFKINSSLLVSFTVVGKFANCYLNASVHLVTWRSRAFLTHPPVLICIFIVSSSAHIIIINQSGSDAQTTSYYTTSHPTNQSDMKKLLHSKRESWDKDNESLHAWVWVGVKLQ